jgi:hypothetical protein
MALYYVTGVSGSGKSAVLNELRGRGYDAYGVDEDRYGYWVERATGRISDLPPSAGHADLHQWYGDHRWTLDPSKIRELRQRADDPARPVFLCGTAEGDAAVWNDFTGVLALVVDEETLKHRLAQRSDPYGKRPEELGQILSWQRSFADTYRGFGATIIDATRSVREVVDEVLAVVGRGSAD